METKEVNNSGKVKVFFSCLLVIIISLIIQIVLSAGVTMVELTKAIAAGTFDVTNYMESYKEFTSNSDVLQKAEFMSVLGNLVLGALWYYFGYIKKEKEEGTYEPVSAKFEENPLTFPFLIVASISCFAFGALLDLFATALMSDLANSLDAVLGIIIDGKNRIISFITVVIMAPIGEELIVRGVIAKKSAKAYGVVGCMVISAVMFALFHLNPIQGLYVIPMGLLWGYVAYKYKSVLPSIFCHAFNNLLGWTLPGSLISNNSIVFLLILMLASGAGAVYMAKRMKIFAEKRDSEERIEPSV
ncbi:MAG: CPBP family intramembrane metalloprotease [Lachnospiraceae bacterium]|nr:CPBP family intramembrane metalloprotease [Lachnospiraceae bacterium]